MVALSLLFNMQYSFFNFFFLILLFFLFLCFLFFFFNALGRVCATETAVISDSLSPLLCYSLSIVLLLSLFYPLPLIITPILLFMLSVSGHELFCFVLIIKVKKKRFACTVRFHFVCAIRHIFLRRGLVVPSLLVWHLTIKNNWKHEVNFFYLLFLKMKINECCGVVNRLLVACSKT